ncbi:5168_t:CDS:2 [Funneliformis geosporum]|uniref:9143_t:CDS:1 n=1 Tax=Funneliformis geosporum TaxID=1117311 RepID=A0A9W4SYK5_9GLOM|nr:9143_t:CDS:2 [Funneliformis geosporum]CAI2183825.1 5168_t:CDS:2 [Funneliformis geosporum]
MAKSLLCLFLLTILCTSRANAGYTITFPLSGDVLDVNQPYNVTWTLNAVTPTELTVDVRLVKGPPEDLKEQMKICEKVDPKVLSCTFFVPPSMVTAIDYSITVGNDPANYGYSPFFTIKGVGEVPLANNGCPKMGGHKCNTLSAPCCGGTGFCGTGPNFCDVGCQAAFSYAGTCVSQEPAKEPVPKRKRFVKF